MKCDKCQSEWKTRNDISQPLAACPFCGVNLDETDLKKTDQFDNSKDALFFIVKTHGAEALLGNRLKSLFSDIAPSLPLNVKRLVSAVQEYGASEVIKVNLAKSQSEKEIAFKIAVEKLTEAFIAEEAADRIINEFSDALGWKIKKVALETQREHPDIQTRQKFYQLDRFQYKQLEFCEMILDNSGHIYTEVKGRVINRGTYAIKELAISVLFDDGDGNVIDSDANTIVLSHNEFISGDSRKWKASVDKDDRIKGFSVRVLEYK